jgi:DNA-binding NarL/FixJ family response regulator
LRILIADDHAVVRSGLRTILGTRLDWQICAEAQNGSEAVQLAKRVHPDVAVVDLNMPGLNGLEVASQLTENQPGIGVVVLTFDYSAPIVNAIWKSGALGLVLKSDADRDLIAAVIAVRRGERFVTPQAQAECEASTAVAHRDTSPWGKVRSPNVEVRAQVRLLAERMKRIL